MRRTVLSLIAVMGLALVAVAPSRAANLTTLVTFCMLSNCADGLGPASSLIADGDGNLFGTTDGGGASNGGTVFEIVKTASGYASTPTTLVSFCALVNCADGSRPDANLIADAKGNLFGTTYLGGANDGGTVFEIAKIAGGYASTPTTLVSFCALAGGPANCIYGSGPRAGLLADAKGNLFGTTSGGGANRLYGTVFEIVKTASGYASTPTTLVSFNGANGSFPLAGLIADAKGNLFGTTDTGGANDGGTVFKIVKTIGGYASTPTTLVSFCALANCADGSGPVAGLIADAKGNLFGTTYLGGANHAGTVFEIAKIAGSYASTPTTLVSFCALANCADGSGPAFGGPLIADTNGDLFGTTSQGGTSGDGTVFEIVKTGSGYASTPTTLVSFNGTNGSFPVAGLIADAKGNLFGTTVFTVPNTDGGTVFEVSGGGFAIFAGTPGKPSCFGKSVSALARQYGGLNAAAETLGYPSVRALQRAIFEYCEPDEADEHSQGEQDNSIN